MYCAVLDPELPRWGSLLWAFLEGNLELKLADNLLPKMGNHAEGCTTAWAGYEDSIHPIASRCFSSLVSLFVDKHCCR